MRTEASLAHEFALADVRRVLGNAERTVGTYQKEVAEAKRESNLTDAFLDYNDSLLAELRTEHPPLAVDVLPLVVHPQPISRTQRLLRRIVVGQPTSIQFEAFYPVSHDFFAYYSREIEHPSMRDLLPPNPLLGPSQMRERLSQEPEVDEKGRLPRYDPPLYDLERRPSLERGSDNTFVTIIRVHRGPGSDNFHLTPDRMDKGIKNLEDVVEENEGELPRLPEKDLYVAERETIETKLAARRRELGNQMAEELRLVTVALRAAQERGIVKLPKVIRFLSEDAELSYELDMSDGRLYALVRSVVGDGEVLKPIFGKPIRADATAHDHVKVMPALLRHLRKGL